MNLSNFEKKIEMALADQINGDIKAAMLAKDKDKLAALRAIKSALLLEATSGNGEITQDAELKILNKLKKQRLDAAQIYREQGREESAQEEEFQAEVISVYLPEQMDEEAVRKVVMETIEQMGASGPQDMGKVMGPLMGKLNGKADGKLISSLVKECLNA